MEDIKIIQQEERPVLSILSRTNVIELPNLIMDCFKQLEDHMASLGEQPIGGPYLNYYGIDMEAVIVEIGFITSKSLPEKDAIKSRMLVKGKGISIVHKGTYKNMMDSYNILETYIDDHKLERRNINYEFYSVIPDTVPEEDLRTHVVMLVK